MLWRHLGICGPSEKRKGGSWGEEGGIRSPRAEAGRGEGWVALTWLLPLPCPVVPPTISVPKGRAVVTVREGSPAELQCEVRGKPRPPVLWSRVDKEAALLPSGLPLEETSDGKLRLERVSRDMSGTYRCQTARYNGFNVRPREAQVQLNVQCESQPTTPRAVPPGSSLACRLFRPSPTLSNQTPLLTADSPKPSLTPAL